MKRKPALIQGDVVPSNDNIEDLIEELNLISFDKMESRAKKDARIKLSKQRLAAIFRS
jgi:hypothetical protein